MKKILAIVLSLTLALSLAACTGSGASSSAPAPSAAPSASAVRPVSTASANSEYYYPVTLEVYNNARELVPYTFEQCPERTLVYGKNNVEIMLALGLEDKILMTADCSSVLPEYEEAFAELDRVKNQQDDGYFVKEYALSLEPDMVIGWYSLFNIEDRMGDVGFWHERGIGTYTSINSVLKDDQSLQNEYADIRNIAARRNPYVQLILYPALVQGDGAAASIVRGIHALDVLGVDVIIVGRGGGSIEDLWAFNEEITARAIFNSKIPIISAVGHETDFTIADFVADLRAPTPSAAAEIAVPSMIELRNRINTDKNRISQNIVKRIESCKLLLKRFKMRTPKDRIDDYYLKIDSLVKSMDNCIKMKTMSLRRQLAEQAAKLDALSPLQTLSRGYSIPTKEDGTVIRSANDMEKGMEFTLRMKDGQTNCVVKGE